MILAWQCRRKSLQIIDFLRNYTVDVHGVGDVCSFAQLDVAKHGDFKVRFINSSYVIHMKLFPVVCTHSSRNAK